MRVAPPTPAALAAELEALLNAVRALAAVGGRAILLHLAPARHAETQPVRLTLKNIA